MSSKDKIAFPISENLTEYAGIIKSTDGLAIPIFGDGLSNCHITAYTKKIDSIPETFILDIHLKDELTNRYYPIYKVQYTSEQLVSLIKRFEPLLPELVTSYQDANLKPVKLDYTELYCGDCWGQSQFQAKRFTTIKKNWKNIKTTWRSNLILTKPCNNAEHRLFYHKKSGELFGRIGDGYYLNVEEIHRITSLLRQLLEKHFPEEFKKIGELFTVGGKALEKLKTDRLENNIS